jgi:hypothetical protein
VKIFLTFLISILNHLKIVSAWLVKGQLKNHLGKENWPLKGDFGPVKSEEFDAPL